MMTIIAIFLGGCLTGVLGAIASGFIGTAKDADREAAECSDYQPRVSVKMWGPEP